MDRIEELRKQIDEIDKQIIKLLSRRIDVAREIGEIKRRLGLRVIDEERERQVLERAGIYKRIFEEIVRMSRKVQGGGPKVRNGNICPRFSGREVTMDGKMRVGIIGFGRMGSLFARKISREFPVIVYDIDQGRRELAERQGFTVSQDLETLVRDSDLIIVATPISATVRVLKRIKEQISEENLSDKVIFDITSIKKAVIPILERYPDRVYVCSTHPLFGPQVTSFSRKRVVIIPIRGKEEGAEKVKRFFEELGAIVIMTDPETHDEMVKITISLPYLIGLSFGLLLLKHPRTSEFSGTSFEYFLNYVKGLMLQDKVLVRELLSDDVAQSTALELVNAVNEVVNMIKEGQIGEVIEKVREKFSEEEILSAYERIYGVLGW